MQAGITTDMADLIFASIPYRIMHTFQIPVYEEMAAARRRLSTRACEKAGFLLDFGDDGSGLFMKYLRRGSGYYIDVGASELVADGSIKLRSGVSIERITRALGRAHRRQRAAGRPDRLRHRLRLDERLGGASSSRRRSPTRSASAGAWAPTPPKDPGPWEGELRNMWKPTQQPALWFHGGNLHQSRHYSQFLALQLKARLEGIPTPVYGLAEVHHLS